MSKVTHRHQSAAPATSGTIALRNERQHGISQSRIALEINPCVDLPEESSKGTTLICRSLCTALHVTYGPQPDHLSNTRTAISTGWQRPIHKASWRKHGHRILRANVNAISIGLPHLDQRIRQRLSIAIEHTNPQPNALAARVGSHETTERCFIGQPEMKEGANRLRRGGDESHGIGAAIRDGRLAHGGHDHTQYA